MTLLIRKLKIDLEKNLKCLEIMNFSQIKLEGLAVSSINLVKAESKEW